MSSEVTSSSSCLPSRFAPRLEYAFRDGRADVQVQIKAEHCTYSNRAKSVRSEPTTFSLIAYG